MFSSKSLGLVLVILIGSAGARATEGENTAAAEEAARWDPLVITAVGTPARESEVPFGVETIAASDIRVMGAADLPEALVSAPGVAVREYGGPGANRTVALRGGLAKQTLVLVDGQPLNNPEGGDVDFNAIPLGDVSRVEVMSGASSALYGANATAGVVNVITRGGVEKPTFHVNASGGSFGAKDADLSGAVPLGAVTAAVGGNYRRGDGFRENDDFEGKGGHAKFSWTLPEDRVLSLRTSYQVSEMGVPGSLSFLSPRARQDDKMLSINSAYDGVISGDWSSSGRLYYKDQKRRYINPNLTMDLRYQSRSAGGRALVFRRLTDWIRAAVGGEFEHAVVDSDSIGRDLRDIGGVLVQDEITSRRANVVAGARYDQVRDLGVVSPRAGIRYEFTEIISARASAGRGFRAPTFDELFWPDEGFGGGNPNLKPEFVWTYEAGPAFRFGRYANVELTYFRSDYDDLINGWPPENVDRAVIQGGEGKVAASPLAALPAFEAVVSGTYLDAKDKSTGEWLDNRPRYTGFAEICYRAGFGDHYGLTPSVCVEGAGRSQYTYSDPVTFETSKRELPAYTLYNVRLAFKAYFAEFYVEGKNLGDEEYQVVYDYPLPGRTFRAGADVGF